MSCPPATSTWPASNGGSPTRSATTRRPSCCTATPSGTCCAGSARATQTASPPGRQPTPGPTSTPRSPCWTGWPPAISPWPPLGQADLENWLAGPSANRVAAGHFARWARRQRLTTLRYPATAWHGPARALDTEARWDQTHRLLHDDTLPLPDRVAGLLVLLYAQHVTTLTGLTVDHLIIDAHGVALRLGRAPIELPEPLAGLVLSLAASRHGHAALTDQGTSPWLFPGGRPGTPISASQLAHRIRAVGVHAGQGRSTAMFALAEQLPAALLAQMLGIHISAAVKWQRASAGDWTTYAADYAERTRPGRGPGYSETSDN